MSVIRCDECERYIDTDYEAEHFNEKGEHDYGEDEEGSYIYRLER
jgi:hypothetical protein